MIDTETTAAQAASTSEQVLTISLIAGGSGAEELANQLQEKGFETRYVHHSLESDESTSGYTYQQLEPVLAQAQQEGLQLVFAVEPDSHRLSVGIRKNPEGPFQLLSVHQLSVLLADHISNELPKGAFTCLRSVVVTDMLEAMLVRKGYSCKTEVMDQNSLSDTKAALETAADENEVLVVTEKGEFWSNRGNLYLVERIIELHQSLAEQGQGLFDRLLELYARWGFYKEKVLAVTLAGAKQEEHYHRIMQYFRTTKAASMASFVIAEIIDYKNKKHKNFLTGKQLKLNTRQSDMLKVTFDDGMGLIFVPSPDKMYLYLSLSGKLMRKEDYVTQGRTFDQRLMKLVELVNKL